MTLALLFSFFLNIRRWEMRWKVAMWKYFADRGLGRDQSSDSQLPGRWWHVCPETGHIINMSESVTVSWHWLTRNSTKIYQYIYTHTHICIHIIYMCVCVYFMCIASLNWKKSWKLDPEYSLLPQMKHLGNKMTCL